MLDESTRASAWRLGDALQRGSRVAAVGFAAVAAAFILAGQPLPGMFVLVAGVGLQLSFGRLWHLLPRALGRPVREGAAAWTSLMAWQIGVLLVAFSWSAGVDAGVWGAGLLLTSAFLAISIFGGALFAARGEAPVRALLAGLVPGAILTCTAALLLALSFREDAVPGLRDVALSLFVFGALIPMGFASIGLSRGSDVEAV